MFSANVRHFPLSSIFTPLDMDLDRLSKPLNYQRIAAACVLPKSRLLVILTFKFNYLDNQKQLSDQLLYVCTHDYVPKTCVHMLSRPELKKYEQRCMDLPISMSSSPDEQYLIIYSPELIIFYELVVIQPRDSSSSSSAVRVCQYIGHVPFKKCITMSENRLIIDCFDDMVWSAIKPCVFVLAFTGKNHVVFTIEIKENGLNKHVYSLLISNDVYELPQNLSALSITNITSTDLDSCVCCIDSINPLESKDRLINTIKKLIIIKASQIPTPKIEKIIVCGGYLLDEDADSRTPHFTSNFIKIFEVNSNDSTFNELYCLKLKYRNSIFEPIRSAFLFPTMRLSVSPRSIAFPFGLYSVDKQIAKQPGRLSFFKKSLSVCRVVSRSCFNVYPDTSKLSEMPSIIYTGYPIVATAISRVSFMLSSINQLHHKFIADSSIDLEKFLSLHVVELVACADTRGYVHIYLTPLHQHRIFSAKLPLLAEKIEWTTTLNDTNDRTQSVFTLYVIGISDMVGQGNISAEDAEVTQTTRVLRNVRTVYSIELPIVDIMRICSVARTTATMSHPVYEIADNSSSDKMGDISAEQSNDLDILTSSPLRGSKAKSNANVKAKTKTKINPNQDLEFDSDSDSDEDRLSSLEYPFNDQEEVKNPSKSRSFNTAHIKVSVKEEYSFYDFPSAEDPPLDSSENGSLIRADNPDIWSLLPEEEEIADLFGNSSDNLIKQTSRLLIESQNIPNDKENSKTTVNLQNDSADIIVRDSNSLPVLPTTLVASDAVPCPMEYNTLRNIVLPCGDFTVYLLSPSDRFSPSLLLLTNCPTSSNLLLDAPPVDYFTFSDKTFILILSNGTAHLVAQSQTCTLSIIDTCSHLFNPHLFIPIACGKGGTIISTKAGKANRQDFSRGVESTSNDNDYSFILLNNVSTTEYHIVLFKIIDTRIIIILQSNLCLQYQPEYIECLNNSVQIALSNGSLFILHINSFLASVANDNSTESTQHVLKFTDVSGLLTPIFNILQTESVLLSKILIQYTFGVVVTQGNALISRLTTTPLTTPIDLALHHAVLYSALHKALEYGVFEFNTTGDSRLIEKLVNSFQETYKELFIDVLVDISNNNKILSEKLTEIVVKEE